MKVALFVEGGAAPVQNRRDPPLQKIWDQLTRVLQCEAIALLVPISKKNLVAMDPAEPKSSGAGEALDQLMARHLDQTPFDAAIVAWDLVPAWDPGPRDWPTQGWGRALRPGRVPLGRADVRVRAHLRRQARQRSARGPLARLRGQPAAACCACTGCRAAPCSPGGCSWARPWATASRSRPGPTAARSRGGR